MQTYFMLAQSAESEMSGGLMTVVNLAYILSSILFIFGLKLLGSAKTARKGNLISSGGMLLAVVITLIDQQILS